MKRIAFLLVFLPLMGWAQDQDSYGSMAKSFLTAAEPKMEDFGTGWISGRCYTSRRPDVIKAGVVVLMPDLDHGGLKQIIPAMSLRTEPDYFDQIDDEEYEMYLEELYADSNSAGSLQNGSFVSDLYYGILIGTLHTRQIGNELIMTMTNYDEAPTPENPGHFYCRLFKKAREL